MRPLLLCLLCSFGGWSGNLAQESLLPSPPLPAYPVVLDTLLALYYPSLGGQDYLAISRQPAGYYVGVQEKDQVYPQTVFPFWLWGDAGPRPLPFNKRQEEILPHYTTEAIGVWRIPQFERHLYYGYPDFTVDAIRFLEDQDTLKAHEILWLARAHEEHASNLLSNQYGTAAPGYRFQLQEETRQKLQPDQLATYLIHLQTAIAHYRQLPPETSTPVGSPQTKATNLYLNGYLALLQYAQPSDAQQLLQGISTSYDAHLSLCAKLLLESCPQNAILITEGDNDTYPLLYQQLVHGYRSDVLVLNRHLLHFPRYLEVLRQGLQIGRAVQLSASPERIEQWGTEAYLPGPRGKVFSVEQAKKSLLNLQELPTSQEQPIAALPFGAVQLSDKVDGPLYRPESYFFGRADLAMLDLLVSNWGKRPIAVATTIQQENFAYSNSWQQIGLAYSLGDEKSAYGIDLPGTLAWSRLLEQSTPIDTAGQQSSFYLDYLEKLLLRSCQHLLAIQEEQAARELIDSYLSHLRRDVIFKRLGSERLLYQMHALAYDPSLVSAYASMLKISLEATPLDDRSQHHGRVLRALQYYLEKGTFPSGSASDIIIRP